MKRTIWTVLGILAILSALAYGDPALAQPNHSPALVPTPTPTPVDPTQPTTRTTIMLPNIGSTGPGPAAPPPRRGYVAIGIVAIVLIASVGFVWRGKKRG